MFDSVAVEVATRLALIFFLVATVAVGVNEVLSRWTDTRAKTLWRALEKLLQPTGDPPDPTAASMPPSALPAGVDVGALTSMSFGVGLNDSRPTGNTTAQHSSDPRFVEDLLATPSIRCLDPASDGWGVRWQRSRQIPRCNRQVVRRANDTTVEDLQKEHQAGPSRHRRHRIFRLQHCCNRDGDNTSR